MHEPFDCGDVTRRLAEYLESALPPDERQGIDEHLATCTSCQATLRELRTTIELLGRLPRQPMPPDLKARLLARLPSRRPRE